MVWPLGQTIFYFTPIFFHPEVPTSQNYPDFQKYRILIDDAITYDDLPVAASLAREAIAAAHQFEELEGERMYFTAQLWIMDENFKEALKYLDLAIAANPNDGAAYNDRALCMIELGQHMEAMAFFDKGIAVEPDFATIHHNKGWFLNQLGYMERALESFKEALRYDSKRPVTYENMAVSFRKLGRFPEAIAAYREAILLLGNRCPQIKKELQKQIYIIERLPK